MKERFTPNEIAFLKTLIVAFNGIAETFNMEMELRWTAKQVGYVAGSLKRKGIIKTGTGGSSMQGTAGSVYFLTDKNQKIIEEFDIQYRYTNEFNYKNADLTKLIGKKQLKHNI